MTMAKEMNTSVADQEGFKGYAPPPPPLETKVFHFHGEFSENQEIFINNQLKILIEQCGMCNQQWPPF